MDQPRPFGKIYPGGLLRYFKRLKSKNNNFKNADVCCINQYMFKISWEGSVEASIPHLLSVNTPPSSDKSPNLWWIPTNTNSDKSQWYTTLDYPNLHHSTNSKSRKYLISLHITPERPEDIQRGQWRPAEASFPQFYRSLCSSSHKSPNLNHPPDTN